MASLVKDECPKCRYSLTGLPPRHRCPECGAAYDERTCYWKPSRPWAIVLVPLAPLLGGLAQIPAVATAFSKGSGVSTLWLIGVAVALIALVALLTRLWRHGRRGWMLAITPDGLLVRDASLDTVIPWGDISSLGSDQNILRVDKKPKGRIQVLGFFRSRADLLECLWPITQAWRFYTGRSMNEMISQPVAAVGLPPSWSGEILTHAGSEVAWRRSLLTLLSDPSALSGYAMLKYANNVQVCRAIVGEGESAIEIICKQSRVDGFLRQRLAAFRASRARLNAQRAARLASAGIATAGPLAILESDRSDRESWLVTRAIPGAVDLDQVAMTLLAGIAPARRAAVKRRLASVAADLFAKLESAGLHHRDLKASNILLTSWDGAPTAWLVDLDGLSRYGRGSAAKERQRLVRLAAGLVSYAGVTRTDCVRFLRDYLRAARRPATEWRRLWRECQPHVTMYSRRAAGRKRDKLDGFGG